jgi:hypothetical protein
MLSDHDREIIGNLPRHEQAMKLLRGECGPLVALPSPHYVAAAAYLIHLAWIRARVPGNMLSGRPGFEAWETMRHRVLTAARRSSSLREWAYDLFRRLNLSISSLRTDDSVWWIEAERVHNSRWPQISTDMAMTEIITLARLLDDMLRDLKTVTPEAVETSDAAQ